MSPCVSIKSLSNLNEEEKEQSQKITMSQLSQSNLWNEIIENFGETSIRKEHQNSLCKEDANFIETIEIIETSISSEPAKAEPNRDKTATLIETSTIKTELLQAEEQTKAKEEHFIDQAEKHIGPKTPNEEGPGFQKFKTGMKKRHCLLCGLNFSYDLGVHFQGGYICEPCRRDGPPPEPAKADSQKKLGDSEAKA
jgi:hypothetical protein